MSKRYFTFKQVESTLATFGFRPTKPGFHTIFRHQKTGVVVSIPSKPVQIDSVFVAAAGRQITNLGIAPKGEFEKRLQASDKRSE